MPVIFIIMISKCQIVHELFLSNVEENILHELFYYFFLELKVHSEGLLLYFSWIMMGT